jgi:hypothetical protein
MMRSALSNALEQEGAARHRWPTGRWGRTIVDHRDLAARTLGYRDLAPPVCPTGRNGRAETLGKYHRPKAEIVADL